VTRITIDRLSKSFGGVRAVRDLSFTAEPGTITGFLGPNGAGKTTTLRILLGLVRPSSGTALIGGRRYADLADPVREVGAVLEASGFHPGRDGRDHLRVCCAAAGLPRQRADEVLTEVGLADFGHRRVLGYSLGMRQRLGLAAALLGRPKVLVLDEPANGLDPAGASWLRGYLRRLAGAGHTVLVSSHVLSEVEQTVDHVVIIKDGRAVRDAPLAELTGGTALRVRAAAPGPLAAALERAGATVDLDGDLLRITGVTATEVGEAVVATATVVTELTTERSGLEAAFLALTGAPPAPPAPPDAPPSEGPAAEGPPAQRDAPSAEDAPRGPDRPAGGDAGEA
jgi:ABC-2 type transport system ATP-binding protein